MQWNGYGKSWKPRVRLAAVVGRDRARSLEVEMAQCAKGWDGWLFLQQFSKLEITQEATGDVG
ncbi:hypothetical protein Pstu01_14040 [Stutzerimonas stutzeri]|nr:hypothetical protein Pstu01_14040 [Stutzerimonas stutzeri]